MRWFRRRQASATELAAQFHTLLACEEFELLAAINFDLPASHVEAYAQRVHLYREAAILLAFVERGPDDPRIAPTLAGYQAILMGRLDGIVSPRTPRGKEICGAFMEIADLVKPRTDNEFGGTLSWVGRWFFGIDHDVTNPVTLANFVFAWMSLFLAARSSVGEVLLGQTSAT